MTNGYVTVRGKNYEVKKGKLEIRFKKIKDISEIQGLGNFTNIQELIIDHNKIKEIRGLENLAQLRVLDLRFNEITELKGLEYLTNLQKIYLKGNPIRADEKYLMGKSAQQVVRYCQEKVRGLPSEGQVSTTPIPVMEPVMQPTMEPVMQPGIETSPPVADVGEVHPMEAKKCQNCGFKLEDDVIYCPNCGVEIESGLKPVIKMNTCPSCDFPLEDDMIFCPNCGKSLS